MTPPLKPPIKPQLARSRRRMPEGDDWAYEPKYDGFRALAFVDGDDVYIQSRGGKPLSRYFPELEFPAGRYVIDGELVILDDDGAEVFDALQSRHPPGRVAGAADSPRRRRPASAPSTCSRPREEKLLDRPFASAAPSWSSCSRASTAPARRPWRLDRGHDRADPADPRVEGGRALARRTERA